MLNLCCYISDVDKILKDGQKYAAMGQRNNSHFKRGALCGNNFQGEASALQSNVVEDDRENLVRNTSYLHLHIECSNDCEGELSVSEYVSRSTKRCFP